MQQTERTLFTFYSFPKIVTSKCFSVMLKVTGVFAGTGIIRKKGTDYLKKTLLFSKKGLTELPLRIAIVCSAKI